MTNGDDRGTGGERLVWVLDPTGRLVDRACEALDASPQLNGYKCFESLAEMQQGFDGCRPDVVLVCTSGYSSAAATALRVLVENCPGLALVVLDDVVVDRTARQFVVTGAQDVIHVDRLTPGLLSHVIELSIVRSETEVREARVATPDPLTGLANRETVDRRLYRALRHAAVAQSQRSVAVIFLDLDGFKLINDRHGHSAGDHALQVMAQRLLAVVRPEDVVGRQGGDEFLIVLEGKGVDLIAVEIAERCRVAIAEPFLWNDSVLDLAASVGVALGGASATPTELIDFADRAQYVAKRAGGDSVHLFSQEMASAAGIERARRTSVDNVCEAGGLSIRRRLILSVGEFGRSVSGELVEAELPLALDRLPICRSERERERIRIAPALASHVVDCFWDDWSRSFSVGAAAPTYVIPHGVSGRSDQLVSSIDDVAKALQSRSELEVSFAWSAFDLESSEPLREAAQRLNAAGGSTMIHGVDLSSVPMSLFDHVSASAVLIRREGLGSPVIEDLPVGLVRGLVGFASGFGVDVIVENLLDSAELDRLGPLGIVSGVLAPFDAPATRFTPVGAQ